MGWDGMLQKHNCIKCGKELNPNGYRPAELYVGTYTGLCYTCQNGPAYIESVDNLDGARFVSHPPYRPAWRRDRVLYITYEGCGECSGTGRVVVQQSFRLGGSYPAQCELCMKRYVSHPTRQWIQKRHNRIYTSAVNDYHRALKKARLYKLAKWGRTRTSN